MLIILCDRMIFTICIEIVGNLEMSWNLPAVWEMPEFLREAVDFYSTVGITCL